MAYIAKPPCDDAAILAGPDGEASIRAGTWVLVATILGSSMAFIDGTVVNVALPAIQSAFQATIGQLQWVVESYALLLAALLLTGGSLGDLYSRRNVFAIGVILFAAASAWCGLATSIGHLIVARAVQGVGGALLVPGSLALISASFPSERRGRAIGTWSGFTSITAAIGPVLGGWVVQHATWRWAFFINLPIALVVVIVTMWRVPECRVKNDSARLDWLGALLTTVGLGGVVYGLIQSSWAGGIAGFAALNGFLYVERRSRTPMLPLSLFRSRTFTSANVLTLFLYSALSGVLFVLPLNLIQVQKYSPTQAGSALLPFILLVFLLSRWSGGLLERYGARLPLTIGPIIVACAFAWLTRAGIGGSYWTDVFPPVILWGLGMAISIAPLTTTVMGAVDQSHAGVASGINNAVSRVAGLLAVAVFGLVMTQVFDLRLDRNLNSASVSDSVRQTVDRQRSRLAAIETEDAGARHAIEWAFVDGYRAVLWIAAGLAVASSLSTIVFLKSEPNQAKSN